MQKIGKLSEKRREGKKEKIKREMEEEEKEKAGNLRFKTRLTLPTRQER